jgi:hypothetical protein
MTLNKIPSPCQNHDLMQEEDINPNKTKLMENRIKIGDVWYVREDLISSPPVELNYMFAETCSVETDKHCFEAVRMKIDEFEYYDDIYINVTFKNGSRDNWDKEDWDSNNWLNGILDNDEESLDILKGSIGDPNEINIFIAFLQKLRDIGWLTK